VATVTRADRRTSENWVWDVATLDWVQMTQPGGGTGGAGDASAANQVTEIARLTSIVSNTDPFLVSGEGGYVRQDTTATIAKESGGNLATIAAKDFATQTTLALIKAKTDNIDVASSTLATSAKQDTGNTSLASIDTKTPALGQALAAASSPVVLTAAQLTTLTPPAAITGFALESTQLTTNTQLGIVTETAPASDTASSGLNGRLQRVAQRLTTLLAVFPTTIAVNSGVKDASTLRVVLATDQPALTTPMPVAITKTDLTPSAPTAASVGVASAQVVAANANRKGLVLVNTSTNRISLGFGSAAVLDSGATLMASGGTYNMGEYDFDLGAVNAIASGASSNLSIQEYTT
jgi:hypothetical protein